MEGGFCWSVGRSIVITELCMAMVMQQHINPLMIKAKKLRRKRLRSTRSSSSSSIRGEELKVACGVAQNPKQAFTVFLMN